MYTHADFIGQHRYPQAGHILLDAFPAVLLFHSTPFSKRAGGAKRNSTPLLQCWEIWQMFEEFMRTDLNTAAYNQLQRYAETIAACSRLGSCYYYLDRKAESLCDSRIMTWIEGCHISNAFQTVFENKTKTNNQITISYPSTTQCNSLISKFIFFPPVFLTV